MSSDLEGGVEEFSAVTARVARVIVDACPGQEAMVARLCVATVERLENAAEE